MTTLAALANELRRPVRDLKRVLAPLVTEERRKALKSGDVRLLPDELEALRAPRAFEQVSPVDDDTQHSGPPPLGDLNSGEWKQVVLTSPIVETTGAWDVRVHTDIDTWFRSDLASDVQRKKLTRYLGCLMARGSVDRAKSCAGPSRGWLRAEMGGNGGRHFYLWFRTQSWSDTEGRGGIAVRAVRHHDQTSSPPTESVEDDYFRITPGNVAREDQGIVPLVDPLTAAQRAAAVKDARIAIIRGSPGTGKTTTLHDILSRLTGRVLYLTFERQLAERTREFSATFGADARTVESQRVPDWVRKLLGTPESGQRFAEAVGTFTEEMQRRYHRTLGPWASDPAQLYHELYAHAYGAAVPWSYDGSTGASRALSERADYIASRATVVGREAAGIAWRIADEVFETWGRRWFDRQLRSFDLARRLICGELDRVIEAQPVDAILVDEVQDLTVTELAPLVAFAWRTAKVAGSLPLMRFAGDEGQTVRPTGFEWAGLKRLLAPLGSAAEDELSENLRAPENLARLINSATHFLYRQLDRGERPHGTQRVAWDEQIGGAVERVALSDSADPSGDAFSPRGPLAELMRAVGRASNAAVVVPDVMVAPRLEELADQTSCRVLTSADAKGLDLRTVVVLDVAAVVQQLGLLAESGDPTAKARARSGSDRVRVAISRATERVIFVDTHTTPEHATVYAALGGAQPGATDQGVIAPLPFEAVIERLDNDLADAHEVAEQLASAVESLIDDAPREAHESATQLRALIRQLPRRERKSEANTRFGALVGRAELRWRLENLTGPGELDPEAEAKALRGAADDLASAGRDAAAEVARRAGAWAAAMHTAHTESDHKPLRDLAQGAVTEAFGAEAPESVAPLASWLKRVGDELAAIERHESLPSVVSAVHSIRHLAAAVGRERTESQAAWLLRAGIVEFVRTRADAKRVEALLTLQMPTASDRSYVEAIVELARGNDAAVRRTVGWLEENSDWPRALEAHRLLGDVGAAARVAATLSHPDQKVLEWAVELEAVLNRRPEGGELESSEQGRLKGKLQSALQRRPSA